MSKTCMREVYSLHAYIVDQAQCLMEITRMSAHAYICRGPIHILPMEITTSNGTLPLFVGSGSGWNSVKQGMFLMVTALQVNSRCSRM